MRELHLFLSHTLWKRLTNPNKIHFLICQDPITDFSFPIRKTDWFGFEEIAQKRKDIKELIYKLKADADSAGDTWRYLEVQLLSPGRTGTSLDPRWFRWQTTGFVAVNWRVKHIYCGNQCALHVNTGNSAAAFCSVENSAGNVYFTVRHKLYIIHMIITSDSSARSLQVSYGAPISVREQVHCIRLLQSK